MLGTTPAPGKYCALNAVSHVRKAATIASIDPAMAVFRGITAEEEAASAVFHAIKRRRYVGAARLNPRDHVHKNSLVPFCNAIERLFAEGNEKLDLQPKMAVVGEGDLRKLELRLKGERIGLGDLGFSPQPPLHFAISQLGGPLVDFSEQIENIATEAGASSVLAHLRTRAKSRNQLLYASTDGVPNVKLGNFLELQEQNVRMLAIIYLLIDPYPEHQLFVSQSLLGFLKVLKCLPSEADIQIDSASVI